MVTVSSLKYSLVADTTRFKAGLDQAQALLKKAESDIDNKTLGTAQKAQKADAARARSTTTMLGSQKDMLVTAGKAFAAFAAYREIKDAFSMAAELETTTAAFATMTGSAEGAASLIAQLRQFDAETTFGFQDTVKGAQRLLNYGVAANDVVDVLRRLGDISGGSADRLHGLTLAFGQATSLGRLQREEVNQMVERGFNPMVEITKLTGESMEELSKRMSQGGVSADELRAAVEAATNAGGRFFGLMDKRAETTAGKIDLMAGKWDMLKTNLVTGVLPAVNAVLDAANGFVDRFGNARQRLADLVMTQPGMAPTVGGPNSTLRRRYTTSQTSMLDLFAKAGDENAKQRTFDAVTGAASGAAGGLANTLTSAASLLGSTAMNVASNARDAARASLIANRNAIQAEMDDAASRSLGPTGRSAIASQRGSRAEFQALSQVSNDREAAARKQRQKEHEEAQTKRERQIELLDQMLKKLESPTTLVPGN